MRLERRTGQHAVHRAGQDPAGAVVLQRLRRLLNRARRVDDVVGDDADAALHVADDVHDLRLAVLAAALVDDRQVRVETLGVRPGRARRRRRPARRS